LPESASERLRRRWIHLASHPGAWLRYLWNRELRHREVLFEENPRFADWRPMWRVARLPLARLLAVEPTRLEPYFEELAPLHAALVREAGPVPSAGALMQAPMLYVLVRHARPAWIVETGISSGYSARLLLEAVRRNGAGHVDSIGIDVFGLAADRLADPSGMRDRRIGWLVSEELKPLWTLHLGKSDEHLPRLLAASDAPLDFFLHDSLHRYQTMRWEYETAWPRVPEGGFLGSHDVHTNAAWPDFLGARGLRGSDAELDHDLGLVRKPATGTSPRAASG
jgi:hypothetical protein